jgi:hypothetical protein
MQMYYFTLGHLTGWDPRTTFSYPPVWGIDASDSARFSVLSILDRIGNANA